MPVRSIPTTRPADHMSVLLTTFLWFLAVGWALSIGAFVYLATPSEWRLPILICLAVLLYAARHS